MLPFAEHFADQNDNDGKQAEWAENDAVVKSRFGLAPSVHVYGQRAHQA